MRSTVRTLPHTWCHWVYPSSTVLIHSPVQTFLVMNCLLRSLNRRCHNSTIRLAVIVCLNSDYAETVPPVLEVFNGHFNLFNRFHFHHRKGRLIFQKFFKQQRSKPLTVDFESYLTQIVHRRHHLIHVIFVHFRLFEILEFDGRQLVQKSSKLSDMPVILQCLLQLVPNFFECSHGLVQTVVLLLLGQTNDRQRELAHLWSHLLVFSNFHCK